jgi:RNA polymerase sigma-70 factor (ECF subfamily)
MESDRDHLTRLSKGEIASFDALFVRYYPLVLQFILGFVKNREDARDLSQDIFLKIWLQREKLTEVENLHNYLFQMAKNVVFDFFRKEIATGPMETAPKITIEEEASLDAYVEARDLEMLIDAAVERMPEQRRKVFHMSRYEGLSNDEIAQQLEISKRTVETHISHALKELKTLIRHILSFFF